MEHSTITTSETRTVKQTARTASVGLQGRSTVDRLVELQNLIGNRHHARAAPDTGILRNQPGVASGGKNLPDITGRWFPTAKGKAAADPRVAQIPGQIARKMRGMHFSSFEDFRKTFWQLIAADSTLSKGWSDPNLARMKDGFAPFTVGSEAVGGGSNAVYQLNHKLALKNAGDVFNINNIEVVSPACHGKIGD